MTLECPLCASRRPFLRVERFKNSDGGIGVRAYQDTGGIAAWRANGFESIPSDAGAQVVEAYTVCRNGHVALDDPGVGAGLAGKARTVECLNAQVVDARAKDFRQFEDVYPGASVDVGRIFTGKQIDTHRRPFRTSVGWSG